MRARGVCPPAIKQQDAVPKRARVTQPRINLTFRWFEPRPGRP